MVFLAGAEPAEPPPNGLPTELQGGNPKAFGLSIETITIQDGQPLTLPAPGVTVIVGGNNVGKSTLLAQVHNWLSLQTNAPPRVLSAATLKRQGNGLDMIAWLAQHSTVKYIAGGGYYLVQGSTQTHAGNAISHWDMGMPLNDIVPHVANFATARNRYTWTAPADRRSDFTQPVTHPIQVFQTDKDARDELSEICMQTFGKPLTFDHLSGSLQFRLGDPGVQAPRLDEISSTYTDALGRLKPIGEQGDGMVFMLGALIPLIAATYPIVLIDEPEAFLHPPQARQMGQALARFAAERNTQVIVATHDSDVLRGLIDPANKADVSIVRLTREGDVAAGQQVDPADVRLIANDPVLRYTNILDGLFHQLVVLAENERDCTFYQAAIAHAATVNKLAVPPHDILFIATNGKGNMARTARVLRNTGVRVVATPDLDILSNSGELMQLVAALGGTWDDTLQPLYDRATNQFRGGKKGRLNKDVATIITAILNEEPDTVYDADRRKRIAAELEAESPWAALKHDGNNAMLADRDARNELLRLLDEVGLVTVAVGELEGFDRNAPKDKNKWLEAALTSRAHESPAAQDHVRRLVGHSPIPAEPDPEPGDPTSSVAAGD